MAQFPLDLGKQSNQGESPLEGIARLINCRPEIGGDEQRVKFPLRATEGQVALGTLPGTGAGVRAMFAKDGLGYAVAGRSISQFDDAGGSTELGGLPSDGFVDICATDRDIFACCDGLGRIIRGGTVINVTDADAGAPISACAVSNHVVTVSADGNIRASELLDAESWDGLAVEKALRGPGKPLRVVNRGDTAIVFGTQSLSAWRYNGNADGFPFAPDNFESIGCLGAGTVCAGTIVKSELVTKAIAWAATDDRGAFAGVCILDGYTARKISHAAVDRSFRDCASPSLITSQSWVSGGHGYMAWTIPGDTTWVYDTATSLWHERQSYGSSTWNIGATCVLGNHVLAGLSSTTGLVRLDSAAQTNSGSPHVVTIQTPVLHAFPKQVTMDMLRMQCVTGVGLNTTTPADLDPVIMMNMSADGETWGTERVRALGRLGQTQKQIYWPGLGTSDRRGVTFKFSVSAAVVRSFSLAFIDGELVRA